MQAKLFSVRTANDLVDVPQTPSPMTSIDRHYVAHPQRWLVLILLLYGLVAIRFALLTPAWQAPDEPAHYNYIATIATQHALPVLKMGDYDQDLLNQLLSTHFDPRLPVANLRYESYQPPLYYLLATPVFWLSKENLLALRLLNVLFGAIAILLLYCCLVLVLPTKPLLSLGAAAFAASLPMHVAVMAAVNNDVLAEVWVLAALLVLLQWIRRQFYTLATSMQKTNSHGQLIVLGLLLGLGLLTKLYAYILAPISVLMIVLVLWRNQRTWRSVLQGIYAALWVMIPAGLLGLPMWWRNAQLYGVRDLLGLGWHDRVVVGQPRTLDWILQKGLVAYGERALDFTFKSFWGVFGWMGVFMDERIYMALLFFTGVLFLGLLWALVRLISGSPDTDMDEFQSWALGLFGLIFLAAIASYAWYNVKFVQHQGRYFFWALLAISTFVALGWREVMQPLQGVIAGFLALVLGGSLALMELASGNLNKWNVFTLVLIALFLLCQPLLLGGVNDYPVRSLPVGMRKFMTKPSIARVLTLLRFCAWATPFALLFLLDLLIPQLYIAPQLMP
ncbi:MAG: glycosyltransferase family 39 protein [Caldilineaceae bacterium]